MFKVYKKLIEYYKKIKKEQIIKNRNAKKLYNIH